VPQARKLTRSVLAPQKQRMFLQCRFLSPLRLDHWWPFNRHPSPGHRNPRQL
jgi:hypothetical protein